jgi:hypothetical protein
MTGLLAVSATLFAAVFLLPQITRLSRRGDSAGISTTWAAFGLITNSIWVVYLGRLDLWAGVMPPAFGVVTYGVVLWLIVRRSRGRAWLWTSGSYLATLAIVGPLAGAEGIGLILAAAPLFQITPGVLAVFRTRHPTGVAPLTWALLAAIGLTRGGYGWLVDDLALIGYGLVTCLGSVLILVRWSVTQGRTGIHPVRWRELTAR